MSFTTWAMIGLASGHKVALLKSKLMDRTARPVLSSCDLSDSTVGSSTSP